MRKAGKWLIAGGALFLCGILLFVAGMALLDWNFFGLDSEKYEAQQFALAQEESAAVTKVEWNVNSFPVTVTAGDAFSLDYYQSERTQIAVTVKEGVLEIKENRERQAWQWFSFGGLQHKFALTVPDGIEFEIKSTNANLDMRGIHAGNLTVRSTNNNLKISDCTFAAFDVHTTNLTAELCNLSCGEMTIDSTNLNLTAKDCTLQALQVKSTNGDVEIFDTVCPQVSLRSTNADYGLHKVTVDDLSLHATNLDAEILLVGVESEYSVEAHGRRMPSNRTGSTAKKVTLSGTNNDVELKWTQS